MQKAGVEIPAGSQNDVPFDDDAQLHDWGRDAVYYMAGKDIIKGIGNNQFNGLGKAKIEEALLIALRIVEAIETQK